MSSLLPLLLACVIVDKESNTPPDTTDDSGASSPITVASEGMSDVMDAATDPKGSNIYFTAASGAGAGVFQADGGTGTLIVDGFDSARNLVVDALDSTIYVAGSRDGMSGIFAVSLTQKTVETIAGTGAYEPQALDLVVEQQADMLYFSGYDPGTQAAGVWRVQVPSGTVQPVPGMVTLTAPDGVAKSASELYVVGEGQNGGTLIRLKDGAASMMVEGMILGTPAGIALTTDDSTLLISSLSEQHTSQVVVVNLEDASTSIFNDVISANAASGGVHRAKDTNVFVWSGKTSTGDGKVYRIEL